MAEQTEVEFFSEDRDGVEYLNVGMKFPNAQGETVRCVLGAFTGEVDQEAMRIMKGLVEEAAGYIIGAWVPKQGTSLEVVKPKLEIVGG